MWLFLLTVLFIPDIAIADFINENPGRLLTGDGIQGNRGRTVTIAVRDSGNNVSKTILIDSESSNMEIRGKDGKPILRIDAEEKTLLLRDKSDREWDVLKTLDNLQPVGTIIYSIKNEAQIQALKGSGWVRCDGRNVNGSRYQKDGHGSSIPDLRNRYLRMSALESDNGKNISEMVNPTSLGVNARVTSQGTVSGSVSASGTTQTRKANLVMYELTGQGRPGGPWMLNPYFNFHLAEFIRTINNGNREDLFGATDGQKRPFGGGSHQEFILDEGHSHPVSVSGSFSGSVSGASIAANITGGGNETRPNSVLAGAYIRIN